MNETLENENVPSGSERSSGVRIAFESIPTQGGPIEVAPGIFWIRLPLNASLDHVNVYALEDAEGWTLVDTGSKTVECRAALDAVFQDGPLSHRPISRVISTHYHPDHIGLAGALADKGATLYSTRVCWLYAKMLQLDDRKIPCDEQVQFVMQAGLKGMDLEAYKRRAPSNYSQQVASLPYSFRRLRQDEQLNIGARQWTVHIGHGHAAHHATLWSEDGIAITGDQILSGTASNLSVHPSEPDADLVSEWLDSCNRFMKLADEQTLCLPGHNLPFRGIPSRCEQLIASQQAVLNRLVDSLDRPKTAVECLETVYRRPLSPNERGALIAETVGFLNHLRLQGLVQRELIGGTAYVWKQSPRRPASLSNNPAKQDLGVPNMADAKSNQDAISPSSQPSIVPMSQTTGSSADPDFRLVKFFFRVILFSLVAGAGFLAAEHVPGAKQFVIDRIQASFPDWKLPRDPQDSDLRESPEASLCKSPKFLCGWSIWQLEKAKAAVGCHSHLDAAAVSLSHVVGTLPKTKL